MKGRSKAKPETLLLDILIKRFEENFDKENSLFPPGVDRSAYKKPLLSALLRERDEITHTMALLYGKLGVKTRDVFRL